MVYMRLELEFSYHGNYSLITRCINLVYKQPILASDH